MTETARTPQEGDVTADQGAEIKRLRAELKELREAADNVRLYTWGVVTAETTTPNRHDFGRTLLLRLDRVLTGRETTST